MAENIDINVTETVENVTINVVDNVIQVNVNRIAGGGDAVWGEITGTLSNQTDLQDALNLKQNSLGFTPENVANKENTTLDSSTTKYPTNSLVKSYVDATNLQKVLTSGGRVTEINQTENVDYTFDASGKYKNIYFQGSFNGFINLNTNTFAVGDEIKFFNLRSINLNFAINNSLPLVNVLYDGVIYEDTSFEIPPQTYCNLVCRALNDYVLTVQTVRSNFFTDAPSDNNSYMRRNNAWFLFNPSTATPFRFTRPTEILHTGTVVESILQPIFIPANTFTAGDTIMFTALVSKLANISNTTHNLKVNTSDTLVGSSTIATASLNTSNSSIKFKREMFLNSGNIFVLNVSNNITNDQTQNASAIAITNFTYNLSADLYLFLTCTLTNAADTIIYRGINLYKQ
jgi:hypothetical protein